MPWLFAVWDAPGAQEHTLEVIILRHKASSCCHRQLLLLYVVENEGTVPIKLGSVSNTNPSTPDWILPIQSSDYGLLAPNLKTLDEIKLVIESANTPEDAKQAIEKIITTGDTLAPGQRGLMYVWLTIESGEGACPFP